MIGFWILLVGRESYEFGRVNGSAVAEALQPRNYQTREKSWGKTPSHISSLLDSHGVLTKVYSV